MRIQTCPTSYGLRQMSESVTSFHEVLRIQHEYEQHNPKKLRRTISALCHNRWTAVQHFLIPPPLLELTFAKLEGEFYWEKLGRLHLNDGCLEWVLPDALLVFQMGLHLYPSGTTIMAPQTNHILYLCILYFTEG